MDKAYEIPFEDPRLGRHVLHDPKSWDYQEELPRRMGTLRTVQHRRYDPRPEPNQAIGCCTGVAECMLGNTKGNRVMGEVLDMVDAETVYGVATSIDPFQGTWPPDDTGSSGLAAAKAYCQLGFGEDYVWYFTLESILQGLQLHPISFGGIWTYDMFNSSYEDPLIKPTGSIAGGHQWIMSGYMADPVLPLIVGECWWGVGFGRNGRFYISVDDFRTLMEQDGDAHYTRRKMT